MKRLLSILIALNNFKDLTGSETYNLILAKTLMEFGHHVEIYAHQGYGPPLYKAEFPMKIWSSQTIHLNPNNYDIIITQHATATAVILKKYPHTLAISINHGIIPEEDPQFYSNLRHYIFVSEEAATRAKVQFQVTPENMSVVPNPIDLKYYTFSAKLNTSRHFLWAGSISNWKIKSLEAAIQITKHIPGARLFVAGQNQLQKDFHPYPHVEYLGVRPLSPEFISQFCMVFGVGRVALEAFAVGIPVYLMGRDGIDGLLTQENFFEFRRCNFSGRAHPQNYETVNFQTIARDINSLLSAPDRLKGLKDQYAYLRKEIDSRILCAKLKKS